MNSIYNKNLINMNLIELLENRKLKVEELTNIVSTGKVEQRKLDENEESNIESLKNDITEIDNQIEEINKSGKNGEIDHPFPV